MAISARQAAASPAWLGRRIVPKSETVMLRSSDGIARSVLNIAWPTAVKDIDGSWLLVEDDGSTSYPATTGWVRKDDVIAASDALSWFNDQLVSGRAQPGAFWLRGMCWENSGEDRLAVKDYELAVRQNPSNPAARLALARTAALTQYDEAKFNDAWRLLGSSAKLYIDWGQALEQAKQPDRAKAMYETAARLNPNWEVPQYALGKLAAAQGKYDDAIAAFDEALRRDAEYYPAHRERAAAWLASSQEVDKIERALRSAHTACEQSLYREAECLAVLARSYAALEQWGEATRYQQMAVEYAPFNTKVTQKTVWLDYAMKGADAAATLASNESVPASKERTRDVPLPPGVKPRGTQPTEPSATPKVALPVFIDRSGFGVGP
ncbi:MAG TPA: tetratricopeptide repeat protein [Pirellulales bacterium]|nr:tetratricopeptide repeat protein [Pirellulales bacterium]